MTSMTTTAGAVTGGVDTHGDTNHAAVLDGLGKQLGDRGLPRTPNGYRQLLAWLSSFGPISNVGIEGTGSYGAGLARHLHLAGIALVEVDRTDRKVRRSQGESDPLDAYAAARAALSGTATGTAKSHDSTVSTSSFSAAGVQEKRIDIDRGPADTPCGRPALSQSSTPGSLFAGLMCPLRTDVAFGEAAPLANGGSRAATRGAPATPYQVVGTDDLEEQHSVRDCSIISAMAGGRVREGDAHLHKRMLDTDQARKE